MNKIRVFENFTSKLDEKMLYAFRFSFRLASAPDSLQFHYVVGSPAQVQNFVDYLVNNEDVITAGAEYIFSLEIDMVYRTFGIKTDILPVEEVD